MARFICILSLILFGLDSLSQDIILFVENPAKFQNSDQKYFLEKYVQPRVIVPDSIRNSCERGFVDILVSVDTTGDISIVKLVRSYNELIDNEVISVIRSSSGLWQPATQGGKKVRQGILLKVPISKIEKNCPTFMQLVGDSNKNYLKGNYVESVRLLNKILEIYPDDIDALTLRVKCKIQLREYSSACKDLMLINTNEAEILKVKAKCK